MNLQLLVKLLQLLQNKLLLRHRPHLQLLDHQELAENQTTQQYSVILRYLKELIHHSWQRCPRT